MIYYHIDVLNTIIQHNPHITSYLEIGTQTGKTFNNINLTDKTGVDIVDQKEKFNFTADHITTSQDFIHNINNRTYDLILCDGDRDGKVMSKDLTDCYNILNDNGYIVIPAMIPIKEEHQTIPRISKYWTGDMWKYLQDIQYNKTFPIYLLYNNGNQYHTIVSNNLPFQKTNGNKPIKDFNRLKNNINELFHVITVDELITLMNN